MMATIQTGMTNWKGRKTTQREEKRCQQSPKKVHHCTLYTVHHCTTRNATHYTLHYTPSLHTTHVLAAHAAAHGKAC